jgi:hypothetical protein
MARGGALSHVDMRGQAAEPNRLQTTCKIFEILKIINPKV